jgi:hypothetical protein
MPLDPGDSLLSLALQNGLHGDVTRDPS